MTDSAPALPGHQPAMLAALVQHIVTNAAAHGLPVAELLAEAGIGAEQLADPNGRIPVPAVERLVTAATRRSGDPLLALHFAATTEPAGFGVTGYMLQAAATVQEVIGLIIRYERLVSDIGQTSLQFQPGAALWCWNCRTDDDAFRGQATDYILCCFHTVYLRWVRPPALPLLGLYLRHEPPADPALVGDYERAFGCPVYFQRPVSGLLLSAEALRQPLANPDLVLQGVLEQHAAQLLEQTARPAPFLARARLQLHKLLRQGRASREALAEALAMSPRHLHRQLEPEGYNYQRLFDDMRLELACQYLADSQDSVNSVAERLQFTEGQSFIRWFRKATGQTPGEYRKTRQAPDGAR